MNELNISELLDIGNVPGLENEVALVEPLELVKVESNPTNRNEDLTQDYSKVREMFYFQQQMLMEAAKVSLEQARSSDAPRVMEVFATLMGQMTTTNKELLRIHKEMKDITSEQTKTNGTPNQSNITATNVFVGTPNELMGKVGSQYDSLSTEYKVVENGAT